MIAGIRRGGWVAAGLVALIGILAVALVSRISLHNSMPSSLKAIRGFFFTQIHLSASSR